LQLLLAAQLKACGGGRSPSAAYAQARPGRTSGSVLANIATFDKRAWLPEQSRQAVYRPQGERAERSNACGRDASEKQASSSTLNLYLARPRKIIPQITESDTQSRFNPIPYYPS